MTGGGKSGESIAQTIIRSDSSKNVYFVIADDGSGVEKTRMNVASRRHRLPFVRVFGVGERGSEMGGVDEVSREIWPTPIALRLLSAPNKELIVENLGDESIADGPARCRNRFS